MFINPFYSLQPTPDFAVCYWLAKCYASFIRLSHVHNILTLFPVTYISPCRLLLFATIFILCMHWLFLWLDMIRTLFRPWKMSIFFVLSFFSLEYQAKRTAGLRNCLRKHMLVRTFGHATQIHANVGIIVDLILCTYVWQFSGSFCLASWSPQDKNTKTTWKK